MQTQFFSMIGIKKEKIRKNWIFLAQVSKLLLNCNNTSAFKFMVHFMYGVWNIKGKMVFLLKKNELSKFSDRFKEKKNHVIF